jgi:hypothetical protein
VIFLQETEKFYSCNYVLLRINQRANMKLEVNIKLLKSSYGVSLVVATLDAILDKVLLVHIGQIRDKTDIWKQDINRLASIKKQDFSCIRLCRKTLQTN